MMKQPLFRESIAGRIEDVLAAALDVRDALIPAERREAEDRLIVLLQITRQQIARKRIEEVTFDDLKAA